MKSRAGAYPCELRISTTVSHLTDKETFSDNKSVLSVWSVVFFLVYAGPGMKRDVLLEDTAKSIIRNLS
jgi:hypothetical protein